MAFFFLLIFPQFFMTSQWCGSFLKSFLQLGTERLGFPNCCASFPSVFLCLFFFRRLPPLKTQLSFFHFSSYGRFFTPRGFRVILRLPDPPLLMEFPFFKCPLLFLLYNSVFVHIRRKIFHPTIRFPPPPLFIFPLIGEIWLDSFFYRSRLFGERCPR